MPLDTLVEIQMRIHSTNAVVLPTPGYDFWIFLRPRFVRASEMLAATIDDTLELVDSEMSLPSVRMLVRPHLRPANLIRTASGSLVVVDNESVTTSTFPLLDVAHTAFGLGGADRTTGGHTARRGTPSARELAALQAAWLARIVGSHFVAGLPGEAMDVVRRYRAGANVLPFEPSLS